MYDNIQANISLVYALRPLGGGQKVKTVFKGDETYENMLATILPLPAPSIPGWGQKTKQFLNGHVVYQIKGNNTYNNMQVIILSLHAPSALGGVKRSNIFFLFENSHVAYQIKRNGTYDNLKATIMPLHTPKSSRLS